MTQDKHKMNVTFNPSDIQMLRDILQHAQIFSSLKKSILTWLSSSVLWYSTCGTTLYIALCSISSETVAISSLMVSLPYKFTHHGNSKPI
jgi:hypothetical protein